MTKYVVQYSDGNYLEIAADIDGSEEAVTTPFLGQALRFPTREEAEQFIETWEHYPSTEDSDELWNGGMPTTMSDGIVLEVAD
jgi:hypothetical protein